MLPFLIANEVSAVIANAAKEEIYRAAQVEILRGAAATITSLRIDVDDRAARGYLGEAQKQVQYAAAVALTRTAKKLEQRLLREMSLRFDRPSPYTMRSTFSTSATKYKLESVVGVKDKGQRVPPALLLKEHFTGGTRGGKPMERALAGMAALPSGWRVVPGEGMPLDAYGNPRRTVVREILGALKSRMKLVKGRGKRASLVGYFVVRPGDDSHLHPGIYLQSGRKLSPMFVFVTAARYQKVIDLPRLAAEVVEREFQREFDSAFNLAMATAR